MGLFRSELMSHKKIRIPKESALDVMEELGKLDDCIQFVDLNVKDFEERKNFSHYIERCDEALKNIQIFENLAQLYSQNIIKYQDYATFKIDLENDKMNFKYLFFYYFSRNLNLFKFIHKYIFLIIFSFLNNFNFINFQFINFKINHFIYFIF